MATVDKYSEVARLATDLRKSLRGHNFPDPSPLMIARLNDNGAEIARLAPECSGLVTKMREAGRIYFGQDQRAAQKYAGGPASLRSEIAGSVKEIIAIAEKKGGEAILGSEHPEYRGGDSSI